MILNVQVVFLLPISSKNICWDKLFKPLCLIWQKHSTTKQWKSLSSACPQVTKKGLKGVDESEQEQAKQWCCPPWAGPGEGDWRWSMTKHQPSTNEGPTKVAKTKDLAKGPSLLLTVQRGPSLLSTLLLGDPSCNFCGQLSTLECCHPQPVFLARPAPHLIVIALLIKPGEEKKHLLSGF